MSLMASGKNVILRRPRSGRLEGRKVAIQTKPDFFTASFGRDDNLGLVAKNLAKKGTQGYDRSTPVSNSFPEC
jgi:hypothetical protein